MDYKIRRVSEYGNEDKPCEEAFYTWKKGDPDWEAHWSVSIRTLEDLQAFILKYDQIIINEDSIDIYDDWAE